MISHKLNEIEAIADKITIIRDGQTIETLENGPDVTRTGSSGDGRPRHGPPFPGADAAISGSRSSRCATSGVEHPQADDRYVCKGSSLYVRHGEIVGIAGLMGAGRTELAMSIFGRCYGHWESGRIVKDGQELVLDSVGAAIRHGIAYVSEDRKALGLNLLDDIKSATVQAKLVQGLDQRVIDGHRGVRRG